MNKTKNYYPSNKKGMNIKDQNRLNELKKEQGLISQAVDGIDAPRRKGRGWWGKASKNAHSALKSQGYRYDIPHGRTKEHGRLLVDEYLNEAYINNLE